MDKTKEKLKKLIEEHPELALRFPSVHDTGSSFDVGVSNSTAAARGGMPEMKLEGSVMPFETLKYGEEQAPQPIPILPPEPVSEPIPSVPANAASAAAPTPVEDKETAVLKAILASQNLDNDKRKTLEEALKRKQLAGSLFEVAGGVTDAFNKANEARFGTPTGESVAKQVRDKFDDGIEGERKKFEEDLINDPSSGISRNAQTALARLLGREATDKTVSGMSANQIRQTYPMFKDAIDADLKKESLANDKEMKRLTIEANKLAKDAATNEKAKEEADQRWTPLGQAKTENDAKLVKDAYSAYKDTKLGVQDLIRLREDKGPEFLDRGAVARGKTIASNLLLQYKNLAKLGVLSQSDYDILERLIPTDPLQMNWPGTTLAKLEQFSTEIDNKMNNFATSYGVNPPVHTTPKGQPAATPAGSKTTRSGISYRVKQ